MNISTNSELNTLLKYLISMPKETEWLEFKVNNFEPQEIGEYISALSNSAALEGQEFGYLVFGVEDKTHKIIGTDFNFHKEKVGEQELENWLATQLNPRIDFKVFQFSYEEMNVVIFRIDPAFNIPVRFKGVEYIRIGSYKKKLSEFPEKERKLWNRFKRHSFEDDFAITNIALQEVFNLIDYSSYFTLLKIPTPINMQAIVDKLIEDNIILKKLERYHITNLGATLFAKDIQKFTHLGRKAIRVISYKGNNRLSTVKEQIWKKGYALGFEGLIEYVNDKLPTNEEIGKALRREVKMYPELAVRELIANAIIHQDFYETGMGPMVEIFDDRIEITNPGKPLISTLRLIDHSPKSRNENLASFMRRIGICEERGSGIDKVINEAEIYQLPAPDFIEYENSFKVALFGFKELNQMGKNDKIRACYQHCCLKYVSNQLMTNHTLRERFKIAEHNASIASRIINDTLEAQLIKDYDPENVSRKYRKYVPIWA